MTGFPLIIAFIVAIVFMIVAISKFKIHPFLSIMGVSLILGLVAGIPLVDQTASDGTVTSGLATVIGAGFSGTFTSIGIVIILGALIGSILEETGAALKLADMVIHLVGKNHPELAMELMGWVVSIPVFCDSGFVKSIGKSYRCVIRCNVHRTLLRFVYLACIHSADTGADCCGIDTGDWR